MYAWSEIDLADPSQGSIGLTVMGGTFNGEVASASVEKPISGGSFLKQPAEELITVDSSVAGVDGIFVIGTPDEVQQAINGATKSVTAIKNLDNITVPANVTVENKTGKSILVNGQELAAGATIPPQEEPSRPSGPDPDGDDEDDSDRPSKDNDKEKDNPDTGAPGLGMGVTLLALSGAAVILAAKRR